MNIPIGAVEFMLGGKYLCLEGKDRIRALQLFHQRKPILIEGYKRELIPVVANPRRALIWKDVNWDTAGALVTGVCGCWIDADGFKHRCEIHLQRHL